MSLRGDQKWIFKMLVSFVQLLQHLRYKERITMRCILINEYTTMLRYLDLFVVGFKVNKMAKAKMSQP